MASFNLTLLIFELKRQLSAIKQNKELFIEKYHPNIPSDVKREIQRFEQAIESLTLQIQLLEE